MTFFPFDNFTMTTALSPQQVKERLDKNIVAYKFNFASTLQGSFGGHTLNESTFVVELIGFRNVSYLTISGSVTATATGSVINAKAKLSQFPIIVKSAVLLFLLGFAVIFISHTVFVDPLTKQAIVLFLVSLVLLALWIWNFNAALRYSKQKLGAIINSTQFL